MASITVQDTTAEADIDISDGSLLGQSRIRKLISKTHNVIGEFSKSLADVQFNTSTFSVQSPTQKIPLKDRFSLKLSTTTASCLTLYHPADESLFGGDDLTLAVAIGPNQYWLCFDLSSVLDVAVGGAIPGAPAGFGVLLDSTKTAKFQAYKLFDGAIAALPTFKDALQTTLGNFTVLLNAGEVRKLHSGTIHSSSVCGSLKLAGSWSLPISANGLSLAEAKIPIKIDLETGLQVKLGGSVSVSGEFDIRTWKQNENTLILAVYKKRGTTFMVSFNSSAGLSVDAANTDLASKILTALSRGVDATPVTNDAAIAKTLTDSIDRSIAISLNVSCAASVTDESALIYSIDLTTNNADTDSAINAALTGDWTELSTLGNATELKNAIRHAVEHKSKLVINLLGVYNHESVADFIKSSTVLHSPEDGSLTITDRATAKHIAVDSAPYVADKNRLRRALDDSTVATAAYSFAGTGNVERFSTKQTFVLYGERMDRRTLLKRLEVGPALNVLSEAEIEAAVKAAAEYTHVLIEVEQQIDSDAAVNMFFDDPVARTPRQKTDLIQRGRRVLSDFLDASDPTDKLRLVGLGTGWDPEKTPADANLRADWIDIKWWANAISNVARPLAAVMDAFAKLPTAVDPSTDPDFTQKRLKLVAALADAAKQTHSAFEEGWPLALTNDIARAQTSVTMQASWNGKVQLEGRTKTAALAGTAG